MSLHQIRLPFEVREPTMFSSTPGGGNSSSTLEFIPGVALRGALAGRYIRTHGVGGHFTRLFDGALRFLDGRLVVADQRSVPVPASARRKKPNSGTVDDPDFKDQIDEWPADGADAPRPDAEYKAYRGWVSPGEFDPAASGVAIVFIGRTAMENGRASDGTLRFGSFLAPDSGQQFESVVVGPEEELGLLINGAGLQDGTRLRMGAGATVGGRVDLVGDPLMEEFDSGVAGCRGAQLAAVQFLSRAVLVDEFLRYVHLPVPPEGWRLHTRGGRPWAYTATEEVHGWNVAQGLPKSPDVALVGGSVVVLECEQPNDTALEQLEQWVARGVGLRTCEGFGEIAVRPIPTQATTHTATGGGPRTEGEP